MATSSLGACRACAMTVWAEDVYKSVEIPEAEQHVALVYKCSNCGTVGKVAATKEKWEELQEARDNKEIKHKKIIKAARIDIASVETVDDLIAEWKTYPELKEINMRACGCLDCRRRLEA